MGRNRVFQVALAVSAVFHLSMVTLFSIQIPFTRPVVVYYPFDIVDPYTFQPVFRPDHATLRAPELEDLFRRPGMPADAPRDGLEGQPTLTGGAVGVAPGRFAGLPTVDLPQLDYANLDLMAIRDMQVELGRTLEAARARPPAINLDRQLERIADTLIRQPLLEGFDGETRADAEPIVITQAAAPGFVAEIEWRDAPRDRPILFASPIAALSGQQAAALTSAMEFEIVVAPGGQVEVARAPLHLEPEMATDLERALERWRFDPINRDTMHEARITLRRADPGS